MLQINLAHNEIGGYYDARQGKKIYTPEGPKAIADAIRVSQSLSQVLALSPALTYALS